MIKWSKKEAIEHVVELKDPLEEMLKQNGGMMSPQAIKQAILKRGNGNLGVPAEEI